MASSITESQRCHYLQEGILFPIRVLSREETRKYRQACDELETQLGGKPRTIEVRQMHLHFRWAYKLAIQPLLLDAVEAVLGPDLLIWTTELFTKHARDPAVSIGWHRDRPYMGFTGPTTTGWVALSDSTAANGCMRAVPGLGRLDARDPGVDDVNKQEAVDVVLSAGEMSLHDADLLHGSGPNHSGEKRVGFVIRYVTPEARPLAGRPPVVVARGQTRGSHFRIVDPPSELSSEQALAGMKESAGLHLDAMLENLRRARQ